MPDARGESLGQTIARRSLPPADCARCRSCGMSLQDVLDYSLEGDEVVCCGGGTVTVNEFIELLNREDLVPGGAPVLIEQESSGRLLEARSIRAEEDAQGRASLVISHEKPTS